MRSRIEDFSKELPVKLQTVEGLRGGRGPVKLQTAEGLR